MSNRAKALLDLALQNATPLPNIMPAQSFLTPPPSAEWVCRVQGWAEDASRRTLTRDISSNALDDTDIQSSAPAPACDSLQPAKSLRRRLFDNYELTGVTDIVLHGFNDEPLTEIQPRIGIASDFSNGSDIILTSLPEQLAIPVENQSALSDITDVITLNGFNVEPITQNRSEMDTENGGNENPDSFISPTAMLGRTSEVPRENQMDDAHGTSLNKGYSEKELSSEESNNGEPTQSAQPGKKRKYIAPEKITRKRQRRPADQTQAAINSLNRRKGEEYIARSGKSVPAKQMGPGCKENCRFKCHSRVTNEERLGVFTEFYRKAPTSEQQWGYICQTVKKSPKKEIKREDSTRAYSYTYTFLIKNEERKVCKTMYLSTHQISNSVVETAFQKRSENGMISPSKRGKAPNSKRRTPEELKDSVKQHINMFPRVPSHYCRKETTREYLEEGMSIAEMHRCYVLWMLKKKDATSSPADGQPTRPEQENGEESSEGDSGTESDVRGLFRAVDRSLIDGKTIATERQYREIFDKEFNLSFFSPKKDQCDDCVAYRHATDEEKRQMEIDGNFSKHLKDKEVMRDAKLADKQSALQDPSIAFGCFDLQKVLYVPQGMASSFYYVSKISVFNFTVFLVRNGNVTSGFCFVWNETIASRGSVEIASCLYKFFQLVSGLGIKEFRMWSDNCTGQNKNRNLFAMYTHAAKEFNIKIVHRFLIKGHTQNEGDTMHKDIENNSKGKKLFVPEHWLKVMKTATVKNPFTVVDMKMEDFLDFKELASKQNWDLREDGQRIEWLKIREIQVDPEAVRIRNSLDEEAAAVNMDQRRGRPVKLPYSTFKPAYTAPRPVSKSTKKGIETICRYRLVPTKYHESLLSLCKESK